MDRFPILIALLLMVGSCHSLECSNVSPSFQTNLKTLFVLLAKNAPLHDGFYETSIGNNSDKVYGVGQCKSNISAVICSNCLEAMAPPNGCPESTESTMLNTLCTSKFSNESFVGVWDNTSAASYTNATGFDKPSVFSEGYSMMSRLASTVPSQPLMYQFDSIDLGEDGKRYGLAQCGRDLSKLNCQNCLEDRLVRYRSFLENRTDWEILGVSCSMWYSNISIDSSSPVAPTPDQSQLPPGHPSMVSGARGRFNGGVGIGLTAFALLAFQALQRFS